MVESVTSIVDSTVDFYIIVSVEANSCNEVYINR